MKAPLVASLVVALVLCIGAALLAWDRLSPQAPLSTLTPYTACKFSDDLAVISVDRMRSIPMMRSVDTPSGEKTVVMADGFRVMFAYPNTQYFANMKVEQFVSERYAEDKQSLIEQLQGLTQSGNEKLEQTTTNAVSVYGLNRADIDGGGVISVYTLFDDSKKVVVTAYILNAEPQHRAFDSMAQYLPLRDKFVSAIVSCMAENRVSSPEK